MTWYFVNILLYIYQFLFFLFPSFQIYLLIWKARVIENKRERRERERGRHTYTRKEGGKEGRRKREREREKSSTLWFPNGWSGWDVQAKASSQELHWLAHLSEGPKYLVHLGTAFQVPWQGAGRAVELLGLESVPTGNAGSLLFFALLWPLPNVQTFIVVTYPNF